MSETENSTIQTLREAAELAQKEAKEFRLQVEKLSKDLETLQMAELSEKEKLQKLLNSSQSELDLKLKEGEDIKKKVENYQSFMQKRYDDLLQSLSDESRESTRNLTFVEGNPLDSLNRLESAMKLLFPTVKKDTSVTNPAPVPGTSGPVKVSGKEAKDLSWGSVFKK